MSAFDPKRTLEECKEGFYMKNLNLFILMFFSLSIIGPLAYAEQDVLTPESIKRFYKRATEVQKEGVSKIIQFNDKHSHSGFVMNFKMPLVDENGGAVNYMENTYNKTQLLNLIRNTELAQEALVDIETEVLSIELSEDMQSAHVKDRTTSKFQFEEGEPMIMSQKCSDYLVLNEGIIQFMASHCEQLISN